MTTISLFFGIVVIMYNEPYGKHHTPHLHARYAEYSCSLDFDGNVLDGYLPAKKLALLRAWVVVHREELEADWNLLAEGLDAFKIDPLR
ncbi:MULTISPECIES: DUF4160 domain-containing protein [Gordonibacter]|uniref:DUF4160 domain-containing protein n=1 Tax=Gordonibacter faecis TaxID=3047475 RepID=A0ABT7DPU9_9ACTN|nr:MULTISPECIES: DUF4160 domain-containing protein [unclassified Gordonibacter]MDJ1651579.1 DUF4160 domain-containing protein [Gordonibacter sp. KGMB12511]HIW77001.1 DUF4160 domain-containing protein [Candidatus Gordonibacter avicola]